MVFVVSAAPICAWLLGVCRRCGMIHTHNTMGRGLFFGDFSLFALCSICRRDTNARNAVYSRGVFAAISTTPKRLEARTRQIWAFYGVFAQLGADAVKSAAPYTREKIDSRYFILRLLTYSRAGLLSLFLFARVLTPKKSAF